MAEKHFLGSDFREHVKWTAVISYFSIRNSCHYSHLGLQNEGILLRATAVNRGGADNKIIRT